MKEKEKDARKGGVMNRDNVTQFVADLDADAKRRRMRKKKGYD